MNGQNYIPIIKLVIIGDSSVGKTCLINRYVDGTFTDIFTSTIGVEYKLKDIKIQNVDLKVQLWDTAGQERFRSVCEAYYRGADGAVIVFDITNIQSFEDISNWIEDFKNLTDNQNNNIIIVGNKSDLIEERQVSPEDITGFMNSRELRYFEVSAKGGENVNEAFQYIEGKIYEGKKSSIFLSRKEPKSVNIDNNNDPEQKKCC